MEKSLTSVKFVGNLLIRVGILKYIPKYTRSKHLSALYMTCVSSTPSTLDNIVFDLHETKQVKVLLALENPLHMTLTFKFTVLSCF